jgi:hypothetical protein
MNARAVVAVPTLPLLAQAVGALAKHQNASPGGDGRGQRLTGTTPLQSQPGATFEVRP